MSTSGGILNAEEVVKDSAWTDHIRIVSSLREQSTWPKPIAL